MSNTNEKKIGKKWAVITANFKEFTTVYISVIIIVFMGWCIYFLFTKVDMVTSTQWEKYLYLIAVVEGFSAFAIGFLFGEKVNKKGAETAEANAIKSRDIADKIKLEADNLKMEMKTGKILLDEKTEIEKAEAASKKDSRVVSPRAVKIDAELKTMFGKY